MTDTIAATYSQDGGSLPFFVGKQYGSGWLRTLAKFAFPILKRVAGVASNTAQDMIYRNKGFTSSLRDNALNEVSSVMNSGINTVTRPQKSNTHRSRKRRANIKPSSYPPLFKKRKL